MSDLHKECPPDLTQIRRQYTNDRFQQLNSLLGSATSSTWTYLLTVNGGAAAGLLAFIGSKPEIAKMQWPYWVLLIFMSGLVLVGFAHAFIVHKVQALVDGWIANSDRYWRNEVIWSYVIEEDQKLVRKWASIPWLLGWASLLAFLGGVAWAALRFRDLALAS